MMYDIWDFLVGTRFFSINFYIKFVFNGLSKILWHLKDANETFAILISLVYVVRPELSEDSKFAEISRKTISGFGNNSVFSKN